MRAGKGKSTAAKAGIYLLFTLAVAASFYFMHATHRFSVAAAQGDEMVVQVARAPRLLEAAAATLVQDFTQVPPHAEVRGAPRAVNYPAPQDILLPDTGFIQLPKRATDTGTVFIGAAALQAEVARVTAMGAGLPEQLEPEYMGTFHNTAYCCEVYPHICGGNGVTASGTVPTPGLTAAADWSLLPPGTWLYIEDVGIRRVEDSGSAIKSQRLDIAVDTHANALRWWGFGAHHVWVLAWPGAT